MTILVNNSGGPPLGRSATATEDQWETAVQRSLIFFGRMCREGIPHLRERGGGRIINILASTVYNPIPNLALSGATRMGVVAYSKSLADEVGRDGILVNNVCPGSILSDRMLSNVTSRANELGISVDEALAMRAADTALGRVGEPGGAGQPRCLPGLGPFHLYHRHDDTGRRRPRTLGDVGQHSPTLSKRSPVPPLSSANRGRW